MSNVIGNNRILHIAYIGRLEKEKGIEDVLKIMRDTQFGTHIHWHIIGDGRYVGDFLGLNQENITLHGKLQKGEIYSILKQTIDITLMPSRFLETFGLVALESILCGVPVIGYKKGGLIPFISDRGALQQEDIVRSFDEYIQHIFNTGIESVPSQEIYTREYWRSELETLTKEYTKILLVHDYQAQIGGAEIYIHDLKNELEKLGKEVHFFGNTEERPSKIKRMWNGIIAPLAIWNKWKIQKELEIFQPDLIWMHGIMRYIGYYGVQDIMSSKIHTFLTHHDFGLMSSRPSEIFEESQIPQRLSIGYFIRGSKSIIEIFARIGKYIYLAFLWKEIQKVSLHIVPSEFMCRHIEHFTSGPCITFPHSVDLSTENQA